MNTVTRYTDQPTTTTPSSAASQQRSEATLLPPVDVIEDATGITLYADMPGVPRDKLQLRVDGDQLNFEGEIVLPLAQGMESNHAEVSLSQFRRAFTLSKELDSEKVSAELSNGVLRVRIPKAEHAKPRKVQIRVA